MVSQPTLVLIMVVIGLSFFSAGVCAVLWLTGGLGPGRARTPFSQFTNLDQPNGSRVHMPALRDLVAGLGPARPTEALGGKTPLGGHRGPPMSM